MIDKTKIIDTVCERPKKLPLGHYLDLKTYRRNRSIIIAKIDGEGLLVIENGYFKERFYVKPEKLRKLLKTLFGHYVWFRPSVFKESRILIRRSWAGFASYALRARSPAQHPYLGKVPGWVEARNPTTTRKCKDGVMRQSTDKGGNVFFLVGSRKAQPNLRT